MSFLMEERGYMLKIMLKEPVGGMISQGQAARSANYLESEGTVEEFIKNVGAAGTPWVKGVSPAGERLLVPLNNIAFIIEVK